MQLHRVVADVERLRDRLVALAAREVLQDLALAPGQLPKVVVAGLALLARHQQIDQLGSHQRRHDDLAAGDAADRIDHVVGVHVLQQVAAHAGPEGAGEVILEVAHRQDDNRRGDAFGADPRQQREAVDGCHPQVHYDEIRLSFAQQPDRLVGVAGGAEHLDAGPLFQELGEPAATEPVIVDQHDADGLAQSPLPVSGSMAGKYNRTRVPAPGALSRISSPPRRSARSRMIAMP